MRVGFALRSAEIRAPALHAGGREFNSLLLHKILRSYSSVGQSVELITPRSAVRARVGPRYAVIR